MANAAKKIKYARKSFDDEMDFQPRDRKRMKGAKDDHRMIRRERSKKWNDDFLKVELD